MILFLMCFSGQNVCPINSLGIKDFFDVSLGAELTVVSYLAKRREFDETGLGDYNVTMIALKNYLQAEKVDLDSFPSLG